MAQFSSLKYYLSGLNKEIYMMSLFPVRFQHDSSFYFKRKWILTSPKNTRRQAISPPPSFLLIPIFVPFLGFWHLLTVNLEVGRNNWMCCKGVELCSTKVRACPCTTWGAADPAGHHVECIGYCSLVMIHTCVSSLFLPGNGTSILSGVSKAPQRLWWAITGGTDIH